MGYCGCCSYKVAGVMLTVIGVVLFIMGFVVSFSIVPAIVIDRIDDTIIPGTDAEGLADYSEASEAPMFVVYHMFNLTNADAWLAGKAKPSVQEISTYAMQLNETKVNTVVEADGCSITYTHNRTYWFSEEMSSRRDMDAMITTLNPVLMGSAVLFNGLTPAVQAALLPTVLTTVMGQLIGLNMPTSGVSLTSDLLASQLSSLALTQLVSGAETFAGTPGLVQMLAALPETTSAAILEQLGTSLPATFVLEPAAFYRDYTGKNLTVMLDGEKKIVTLPSTKEIWPSFEGFTEEEGKLFVAYLNGTKVSLPIGEGALSTALVYVMQGLFGEGLADEYALMAAGNANNQATLPAMASALFSALNITTTPCQGNESSICGTYARQLNVDTADNFAKLWMLSALNDYYTSWTQLALGMLADMNGGLVIKGTVSQWLNGFNAMAGMSIPSIMNPGPEGKTRTMYTGSCDDLDVGTWYMQGGKTYVDPKLYPYSCPDALTSDDAAASCKAIHITGSDGMQFPRTKKPRWNSKKPRLDEYLVWVTEINRNLPLINTGDTVNIEGITVNHFVIPSQVLNTTKYNSSDMYGITCDGLLEGAVMLKSPTPLIADHKNIAVGLSRPHFLYADPKCTVDLVDGLSPDPDLHEIYLDIEPYSGATMNARKRLQVSLLPRNSLIGDVYTQVSNANLSNATVKIWDGVYDNVSYAPIPYYFVEQRSTITPSMASKFRRKLYRPLKATFALLVILPILGGLCIFAGGYCLYRNSRIVRTSDSGMSVYMDTQVSVIDKEKA